MTSLSMEMITLDLALFFVSHFRPKRGILNSEKPMSGFSPQGPHHKSFGAYLMREADLGSWTVFHGVIGGFTSVHQMAEPLCGNHLQQHGSPWWAEYLGLSFHSCNLVSWKLEVKHWSTDIIKFPRSYTNENWATHLSFMENNCVHPDMFLKTSLKVLKSSFKNNKMNVVL